MQLLFKSIFVVYRACATKIIHSSWLFRLWIFNHLLNKECVTLGLAIYIKKYLKTKEELWKLKYFTMQKYNLQKNPLKETKILQDIITL
jgi:hypothetical protein